MKANIFEIKHFAVHDGDGIRTTVFFKGCPLRCVWCHNPEGLIGKHQLAYYAHRCIGCGECVSICPIALHTMVNGKHIYERNSCIGCGKCADVCLGEALHLYGRNVSVDELMEEVLEDRAFYENSGGGVTLSGGECLAQADFCAEFLKRLKERGINTAIDTCGYVTKESLDKVIPYTDRFLYDIKAIDEDVHICCTGVSNKIIIENLKYLDEKGCQIEIRIPFVPQYNDGEIGKIAEFLSTIKNIVKVRILPYHSYASSKYRGLEMKNTLPEKTPTTEEIKIAEEMIQSYRNRREV